MSAEPSPPDTSASGPDSPPAQAPPNAGRRIDLMTWAVPLAIIYCLGLAIGGGVIVVGMRLAADLVYWPLFVGLAVGILVAFVQRHPRRALGLIPYGAAGILVTVLG